MQCYCVIAASPILFGNPGGAGDSIIPTLVREQNEGIHKGHGNSMLRLISKSRPRSTPSILQREKPTLRKVLLEVARNCRIAGLTPPSMKALQRTLRGMLFERSFPRWWGSRELSCVD